MLRGAQSAHEGPAHPVQGLIGTGLDAARPRGSLLISRYGRFAPVTLAEPLARGIAPIVGEAPHQMRNHRPAQTKVQIVTGLARRIGPPIRAEDVHAAGETRLAIDHQQLAVIAQMRGMQARGNQCRVERRRRNAGALQGAVGAAGVQRAYTSSISTRTCTPRS